MSKIKLPWLKEYSVHGVPKSLKPYPEKPVHDILYNTAKKYKKMGLIQFNYKMTYPEVKDKVDRLATALYKMGLRKGDRVATLLPTSIQFVLSDYAISRAGLVHVPSSSLEPVPTLEHKFKEGTPRALICLDQHLDIAKKIIKRCKIEFLIVARLDDFPEQKSQSGKKGSKLDKNAFWMIDLINENSPEPPELSYNVEEDIETLLFTGGTTGIAKGCMLTHRNIYANAMQNSYAMGQTGRMLMGTVSVLLGLPFFHSYGHIIMHTMTLYGFNQILIPEPRDTDGMIKMIKEHFPILQIGVPTQFMKISEELDGIGILGISGSAPLPLSTQEKFEKKSGGGIMEGYGLSEMSPNTHLNTSFLLRIFGGRIPVRITNIFLRLPGVKFFNNFMLRLAGSRNIGRVLTKLFYLLTKLTAKKHEKSKDKKKVEKRGTIGVPFPDTEVKFLSVETGAEIPVEEMLKGARGEMLLRGPQRMLGYWPEAGTGVDNEGFIHTSDVVKIDEHGYFYIVDRTKDMIIVSGYKVYSREVDDVLYSNPKVEMAATIGIPDPEREGSERIAVYIQPKAEYRKNLKEGEVIEFLKKRIAKYAVPKVVKIIDEMPLTEVQKVNKKLLREMAEKDFSGGATRAKKETAKKKSPKKKLARAK